MILIISSRQVLIADLTLSRSKTDFFCKLTKEANYIIPPPLKKKDKKLIDKVFTEFIFFLIYHDPIFELIQNQSDFIQLTLQNKM